MEIAAEPEQAPDNESAATPSIEAPLPQAPRSPVAVGVAILAVLAIVATLHLARAFFVPLLLGILASYALGPLVDWLQARGAPRAIGAALVLVTLAGGISWAVFSVGDDVAAMITKLPQAARELRVHVGRAQSGGPSAMQQLQEAATELQHAANDASGDRPAPRRAAAKAAPEVAQSPWLRDYLFAQSALLVTVVAQAPIVLLLCYFLLAAGQHFRRKLVELVGPTLTQKKEAVAILQEVDSQIQRYLLVTVVANIVLGAATFLAFAALGMEHAGAWGIGAGILHFIPYLGPLVFAMASGIAAFTQFGTATDALLVSGTSLLIATAVGTLITTWVQGRFARVNAAVLFIALLFFGWLWGVWGLLLGAPLLAIAKAICDRVASLQPVGRLLGH